MAHAASAPPYRGQVELTGPSPSAADQPPTPAEQTLTMIVVGDLLCLPRIQDSIRCGNAREDFLYSFKTPSRGHDSEARDRQKCSPHLTCCPQWRPTR